MNTSIKILSAIVLSYLLIACDKSNPGPINPETRRKADPNKSISGQFEVENKVGHSSVQGYTEYIVTTEGRGEVNILGPSEIYLEHRRVLEFNSHKEFIEGGHLTIVSDNGTELRGIYTNIQFLSNGGRQIPVRITGGTGELVSAYGNLVVEMLSQPNEVGKFSAEIRGLVYLRGRDQFPVLI